MAIEIIVDLPSYIAWWFSSSLCKRLPEGMSCRHSLRTSFLCHSCEPPGSGDSAPALWFGDLLLRGGLDIFGMPASWRADPWKSNIRTSKGHLSHWASFRLWDTVCNLIGFLQYQNHNMFLLHLFFIYPKLPLHYLLREKHRNIPAKLGLTSSTRQVTKSRRAPVPSALSFSAVHSTRSTRRRITSFTDFTPGFTDRPVGALANSFATLTTLTTLATFLATLAHAAFRSAPKAVETRKGEATGRKGRFSPAMALGLISI